MGTVRLPPVRVGSVLRRGNGLVEAEADQEYHDDDDRRRDERRYGIVHISFLLLLLIPHAEVRRIPIITASPPIGLASIS